MVRRIDKFGVCQGRLRDGVGEEVLRFVSKAREGYNDQWTHTGKGKV